MITNLAASDAILGDDWIAYSVRESVAGEDLNRNGDISKDDSVVHVRKLSTGDTRNLGLAGKASGISGDWLVIAVWESRQRENLNGDGDTWDSVAHGRSHPVSRTTRRNTPILLPAGRVNHCLLDSQFSAACRTPLRRKWDRGQAPNR